jgi:chromosome segregation ATPase
MASFTGADAADTADAVNVEQRFHEMEQRFVTLREDHSLVVTERNKLREAIQSIESDLDDIRQQKLRAEAQLSEANVNVQKRQSQIEILSADTGDLSDRLERKQRELDLAREQNEGYARNVSECQAREAAAQNDLRILQAEQVTYQPSRACGWGGGRGCLACTICPHELRR